MLKEEEEELFFLSSSLKTKSQIRNPHFIIQGLSTSALGNYKENPRLEKQQQLFAGCCSFNNYFSFNSQVSASDE
jgi:hypothetical protein